MLLSTIFMFDHLAREIVARLKSASSVGLVFHFRPDPDSLGSGAALAAFLEAQGIPYFFYCISGVADDARLFDIDPTRVLSLTQMCTANLEIVCTFDAGDIKFAGLDWLMTSDNFRRKPLLINFDHHVTNTRYGDINVIDTECSSTTEVMYKFFKALDWKITKRVAQYLLAGILVDTDHFSNPATTSASLTVAADLLSHGAPLLQLRQFLFERRGLSALRFIGEVLSRLRKNPRYNLAVTYLTDEDIKNHGLNGEEIEGLSNILNLLGDVKAMLLLKGGKDIIRGSLRTTSPEVDVGRLAEVFGGGGHRKAAGFTVTGTLQNTERGLQVI
ncbi:MAG: MgpA protein [Parcubacteria group bacterium GW2011_GWA2_47_26]|nr:MAG: MgpA protein [Parcubacteria group bacterium GW2011_GWA2_47_26]